MSYWAVAQTEPQREHIARVFLMRHGYETYAPRVKIQGRVARLFPTYIFIRIVDRWYPARWSIGIQRILMAGEVPAKVPERVLKDLRERDSGGFVKLPPANRLRIGAKMRVLRGPFAGHIGLHDGMSGADRQRVLLELLGQHVSVEMPARDIVPLPY